MISEKPFVFHCSRGATGCWRPVLWPDLLSVSVNGGVKHNRILLQWEKWPCYPYTACVGYMRLCSEWKGMTGTYKLVQHQHLHKKNICGHTCLHRLQILSTTAAINHTNHVYHYANLKYRPQDKRLLTLVLRSIL